MMNNKFLTMGATAMGIVALASALTLSSLQPTDIKTTEFQKEEVTQNYQLKADSVDLSKVANSSNNITNSNNFTNISFNHGRPSESSPLGSIKEVSYEGKVVGQIKQTATGREVSSNLSAEDTVRIFKELKDSGKADNLDISDANAVDAYKNITDNIGAGKKSYVTDIETVLLSTSISYRNGTSLSVNSPAEVAKNISNIRNSMSYKANQASKITMG